jgi:cell division transport system permease protein
MSRRADLLGLRFSLTDRLLPMLVGAMSFLAALAIAGTLATTSLARQWQGQAAAAMTVQILSPNAPSTNATLTRLAAVQLALSTAPNVSNPQLMSTADLNTLLAPWLGGDVAQLALPVPAVITANWQGATPPDALTAALDALAPGTLVQTGAAWAARVAALTASLEACAASILVIVALVASAVVAVATRAGLAQRREAIEIIHGLGAQDEDIASSYATHTTLLTLTGGILGTLLALPVLFWLSALVAPFSGQLPGATVPTLPLPLWIALPTLPLAAALIGWGTAQFTVRGWLRSLV